MLFHRGSLLHACVSALTTSVAFATHDLDEPVSVKITIVPSAAICAADNVRFASAGPVVTSMYRLYDFTSGDKAVLFCVANFEQ